MYKYRSKAVPILISLIVLLSIAVGVLSYKLYYPDEHDNSGGMLEYYNEKCAAFYTQNSNLAQGQIVFIGDSITDGYVLDHYYSDLDYACYNRGISGDSTAGVLNRLEISALGIRPSKIVLMIGINDINFQTPSAEITERYERIVNEIYAALPEVELYCMSILPMNETIEKYSTVDLEQSTARIIEINSFIRELSDSSGATYVDLFSFVKDENNHMRTEYTDDGLHLNAAGYEVWTEVLKPYLI